MSPLSRLLVTAAVALTIAPVARAASGSGTISFEFTSFEGPFASTETAFLNDPANWQLTGAVNGQIPTVNGVTSAAFPGYVYVGGTLPLSGNAVTMGYTNVPGAIQGRVEFNPAASFDNVVTGQEFLLGTLVFNNGQWVGGGQNPADNYPVTLNFRLTTTSATPEFNQVMSDAFTVVTNQAVGDCGDPGTQKDEADFIYLRSAPELGSMRVFDFACAPSGVGNVGAVEIWGRFGSLHYVDFRNPSGGAFLSGSVDVGPIGGGVPEPGTWSLAIAGFGLAGAALRRRRSGVARGGSRPMLRACKTFAAVSWATSPASTASRCPPRGSALRPSPSWSRPPKPGRPSC
ncbi:MAG: PEP-CTERM sorting domain-containing protein [Phenylobacterium sp.]|uniref:PEPxxWA-CTERM sorting domain-containing protein n=1 Tax=Phenylobacterium sp. TaxID=1871053 RepID=UPI001A4589FC|nr:PEPxxWA-CTERM sorting domain-containing protein [Phenylobacterium sp.]MBL8555315.1 PEP-CTERM sorting domain-containing protein [Phenylobacterium sp.]